MQYRHYLKILPLVLLCVGLLLIVSWWPASGDAPTALAHAFVTGSDPIDGSTITKPPTMVRIFFDAPVSTASWATVQVFVPGSSNGLLVNTNHGVVNATNAREFDISLLPPDKLPQGGYEVNWTALSTTDGYTTSGLIGFNLGISNTGVAGEPTLGPSTSNNFPVITLAGGLSVAWDWLVMLALLFWVGILITEALIVPRALSAAFLTQTRKHSRSLQTLCLAGLLVGEVINLVLRTTTLTQTLGGSGISLGALAQFVSATNYGHLWLVRIGLLLLALLFFWWSGWRERQAGAAIPATGTRSSRHFRQLRQRVQTEARPETPGTTPSVSATSKARGGGAVANTSAIRVTATSQPKNAAHNTLSETPAYQPSTFQKAGGLVLAGLIMLTLVLSNEIIQLASMPISAGLFSWLALAAQATWFGCLAYLSLTLLPLQAATNLDQRAETLIRTLRHARPFLFASIGILLVSELFLNEATIQTLDQLLNDPYGRALLVQNVLLVLMLLLTGHILLFLLPRLQRQSTLLPVVTAEMPARRTRTAELEKTERTAKRELRVLVGLVAVTLLCAALMDFFAPPVVFPNLDYAALANQAAASTPSAPTSQTQTVGGLSVTLRVAPANVGATNTVTLTLDDTQGQAVSNATIKLTINMQIMNMGTAQATLHSNSATYTTTFTADQAFSMAGVWVVQVEIDRPAQQALHLTFQVTAT